MDFKKIPLKYFFWIASAIFLLIGFVIWTSGHKADAIALENPPPLSEEAIEPPVVAPSLPTVPQPQIITPVVPGISLEENMAIQEQLDRDRIQQKQTKDLKVKLEQTNLQLEEEKALAEINKLKKENMGSFNEPAVGGQNNLPEIKVDYIGGNDGAREAILSIAGTSYQVKEKTFPVENIKVVAISNSAVTVHFSAPEELTKTIDFKPE